MADYQRASSLDDFQLTRDEVDRIGNALKKEEFRKLLVEYVEEINDPENKKKYEEEITLLEKERGFDVTFIKPEPGYVIKTSVDGQKKAFINVCKSDKLEKPTSEIATKSGSQGLQWSMPYCQAPPRDDLDKLRNRCTVYDVVFHPDTHHMAENNIQFKNMLTETALDAVENNFNVTLDRKNIRFPNLTYKGVALPTVIRKKSLTSPITDEDDLNLTTLAYPYSSYGETSNTTVKKPVRKVQEKNSTEKNTLTDDMTYTTPKYLIKHRSLVDIQDFTNDRSSKMNAALPKELVLEVHLPLLNSSEELILDVMEKSVSLQSEKPAKYKLHLILPYTVDEDAGNAKFDKSLRKLIVTLPLKYRRDTFLSDIGREDSGVESDMGCQTPESSSGDDDSIGNEINTNSKIEDEETELSRCGGDEAYRTNSVSKCGVFLNPDLHYSFPPVTCNVMDNTLAFILHVKNVDPSSVAHCSLGDNSAGVHVRFTSVGSGFFPIHFAFCVKFPPGILIDHESQNIETWDNNVIVQIQLKSCDTILTEYYAGVNEDCLKKHDLPEPAVIGRKLEELQVQSGKSIPNANMNIKVTKRTSEEIIVEISPEREAYSNSPELQEDNELSTSEDMPFSNHPPLYRTMSESSGDELGLSPTKKGILKYKGRVCRSLSESCVDDYIWPNSLDMVMHSGGSESCIPKEDDERRLKKTVRFSEIVSQKVYRTNSSILGQRKKNQRKMRNKKRAQERRASESENSEGEVEKEKGREKKTEDEELNNNDVEENDDDDEFYTEIADEEFETKVSLHHEARIWVTSKGKKKTRPKVGETVLKNQGRVPRLDLRNNFIFDLDI